MPDQRDDLFSSLEQFFQLEREQLGESLIVETPNRKESTSMPVQQVEPSRAEEQDFFPPSVTKKPSITGQEWGKAQTIEELNAQICECTKCPLGHTRTKFVFGVGNPRATLMVVGEAPGADEDAQGEPFVGRAGQLLNKILKAINFEREEVYICNILKCRPPNNRQPQPDEVEQCLPYLRKQIELVKPRVILCVGLTAAHNLLNTSESLTKLRGRQLSFEGIPLMVTYHPAALLRNPNWKPATWEDVKAVRKLHDELVNS